MAAFFDIEMVTERVKDNTTSIVRLPCPQAEFENRGIALGFSDSLPSNWIRGMEPKTGISFFINKETGKRTTKDPRATYVGCYWNENFVGGNSSLTSSKDTACARNLIKFLNLMSCKGCMKYMMLMQDAKACPWCGARGLLVHFEDERCF